MARRLRRIISRCKLLDGKRVQVRNRPVRVIADMVENPEIRHPRVHGGVGPVTGPGAVGRGVQHEHLGDVRLRKAVGREFSVHLNSVHDQEVADVKGRYELAVRIQQNQLVAGGRVTLGAWDSLWARWPGRAGGSSGALGTGKSGDTHRSRWTRGSRGACRSRSSG